MKNALIIGLLAVFSILAICVEASHTSYTGTNFYVCLDKCVTEHSHSLASAYACEPTCRNIVNANQQAAKPAAKPKVDYAKIRREAEARRERLEAERKERERKIAYDRIIGKLKKHEMGPKEVPCNKIRDMTVINVIKKARNSQQLLTGEFSVRLIMSSQNELYKINTEDGQVVCYGFAPLTANERFEELLKSWKSREARLGRGGFERRIPCPKEIRERADLKYANPLDVITVKVNGREIRVATYKETGCYAIVPAISVEREFGENTGDIIKCPTDKLLEMINRFEKQGYKSGQILKSEFETEEFNYNYYLTERGSYCFKVSTGGYKKTRWAKKHSSIVPVPDLTQEQIDYIADEMREAKEEKIYRATLIGQLTDSFKTRRILYDLDFSWAPGLNIQVSSRPDDIAIWGAKVVGNPALEKAKGKITAFALSPKSKEAISNALTIVSKKEALYEITQPKTEEDIKISGTYIIGPYTIVISYAPELIPKGKSEKDIDMFRYVVIGGKASFSKVKGVFVDRVNHAVMGKVDDTSIYTLGILKEEEEVIIQPKTIKDTESDEEVNTGSMLILFMFFLLTVGAIGITAYFIKRSVKSKKKTNTWGIASLVLGILGFLLILAPYIALPLSVGAIYFYRVQRKHKPTKMAIAGLVLGIIGTIINSTILIAVGSI